MDAHTPISDSTRFPCPAERKSGPDRSCTWIDFPPRTVQRHKPSPSTIPAMRGRQRRPRIIELSSSGPPVDRFFRPNSKRPYSGNVPRRRSHLEGSPPSDLGHSHRLGHHHDAAIASLIPWLSCWVMLGHAGRTRRFAQLVPLSPQSVADAMREEYP